MSDKKFEPKDHMTNLKGKQYLEVKWRLVWFREDHPNGGISTELVSTSPVVMRAVVSSEGGVILGTGHGTAQNKGNAIWSGREIEKAETAAIGRALAHCGYGTQFDNDDDESEPVDSPVSRQPAPQPAQPTPPATVTPEPTQNGTTGQSDLMQAYSVTVRNAGGAGKNRVLVFNCGGKSATAYSRDVLRTAGYACEDWTEVDKTYKLEPAAVLNVEPKQDSAGNTFFTVKSLQKVA